MARGEPGRRRCLDATEAVSEAVAEGMGLEAVPAGGVEAAVTRVGAGAARGGARWRGGGGGALVKAVGGAGGAPAPPSGPMERHCYTRGVVQEARA